MLPGTFNLSTFLMIVKHFSSMYSWFHVSGAATFLNLLEVKPRYLTVWERRGYDISWALKNHSIQRCTGCLATSGHGSTFQSHCKASPNWSWNYSSYLQKVCHYSHHAQDLAGQKHHELYVISLSRVHNDDVYAYNPVTRGLIWRKDRLSLRLPPWGVTSARA